MTLVILVLVVALASAASARVVQDRRQRREAADLDRRATALAEHYKPEGVLARRARRRARRRWVERQAEWSAGERQWN